MLTAGKVFVYDGDVAYRFLQCSAQGFKFWSKIQRFWKYVTFIGSFLKLYYDC